MISFYTYTNNRYNVKYFSNMSDMAIPVGEEIKTPHRLCNRKTTRHQKQLILYRIITFYILYLLLVII